MGATNSSPNPIFSTHHQASLFLTFRTFYRNQSVIQKDRFDWLLKEASMNDLVGLLEILRGSEDPMLVAFQDYIQEQVALNIMPQFPSQSHNTKSAKSGA